MSRLKYHLYILIIGAISLVLLCENILLCVICIRKRKTLQAKKRKEDEESVLVSLSLAKGCS